MASVDDLWVVDFGTPYPGEPANHRPALVLGPPDSFGTDVPFIFLCPLTSTRRGLGIHVEVEATESNRLDETSYVQCEMLRSVNRRRLRFRLGAIDLETHRRVELVIKTLLNH